VKKQDFENRFLNNIKGRSKLIEGKEAEKKAKIEWEKE
jgi:hypothetical protein